VLGAAVCERKRALETHEEFLAIVSHDLRSPLSSIEMSASAIAVKAEREGLPGLVLRRSEGILRSCARMSALISDLLDFSAMQRGRLRVEKGSVDVRRLLEELFTQLQPLAEQKRQKLLLDLPRSALELSADRTRLAQALSNLVSNAIKFTPEGGRIAISCETLGRAARFAVKDSGPGLSPEQIPHLFEPYWQAKASQQGVGLGLAIAKGVVEAHGGEIHAHGNPGEPGSTFAFTIPLNPEQADESKTVTAAATAFEDSRD
jgi:signal transduction histidine kinase